MQPYFFPSLGYFQLASAVDHFCFYDDVTFIKGSWINRNRILQAGKPVYFSVPLRSLSSNVLINETMTTGVGRMRDKLYRTLQQAYGRLKRFEVVADLVMVQLPEEPHPIAELASGSVRAVFDYLGCGPKFYETSRFAPDTRGLGRVDRLVEITRRLGSGHYVNTIGGQELYDKTDFSCRGMALSFLKTRQPHYPQNSTEFIPNLSIIDVLMQNEPDEVRRLLNEWDLV
jgi:hypothetical protein